MVETEKIIEVVKRTKPFFRDREAVGNIRVKGLADYATQVDDGVQKFLAEELKKMYPDIGFLGEESYAGEQVSGRMWIVDPVDGTTNLIHHYRQSVVSAAFDLAHVAEGSTEAYFERNLKIWDYAAGLLLIREAGGDVTDYEGNPIRLTSTINNIVADNGHLGEEIRAIINE